MTVQTDTVIYTADIAKAAREFARQNGVQVGTRGRVSLDLITKFLVSQPKTAREVAEYIGVDVSKRGRISATDAQRIAAHVR